MKFTLQLIAVLLMVPFLAFSQTVEFFDDFESGTDNWVLEGSWGLTTAQSNSPTNSLTDSPGGNYAANLNISATLAEGIDLSSALDATLNFAAIYDIEGGNFDYVYVEGSGDGGSTWINIATFLGEDNLDPWVDYSYSLGAFVGSNDVRVRFRLFTDGGYEVDGMYIDDVEITSSDVDNSAPLVQHTAPEFYEANLGDVARVVTVTDISGVASATLTYSVDGGVEATLEPEFSADDVYIFLIPTQMVGAQVDYYVTAVDASANANVTETGTFSYIAGQHMYYDNAEVDFVNSFGPDAQSGLTGAAVRFTLYGQDVRYALIRNYTDTNRPNNDMMFHIWADNDGVPGDDLIDPFLVTPEASLDNNSPMTRIDLSAFSDVLSNITGDIFMGYTVPEGETWLVQTTPAVGNRTYVFDGMDWAQIDDDYHFRLVTTLAMASDDCLTATDLNAYLGGGLDNTVSTPLFDNTNAFGDDQPETGAECFDDGGAYTNTQWYTFVGDGNAYFIRTGDCGSTNYNDDTQIAVYSGPDCGNLTPVACNEDIDLANQVYEAGVTVETEEGVTYYMFIDGWDGTVGEYCIQFTGVSVTTCEDIALGAASADSQFTCFGDVTSFNLDGETIIPDEGPQRGFRWVVTTGDISGSMDPGGEDGYLGAFGAVTSNDAVYTPGLTNDGLQLLAGDYYFTPIVYAGATGTFPALDYSNGCIITGTSVLMTLLPELDALEASTMVTNETTPPGNNGEVSVEVVGGTGGYNYAWSVAGETGPTITGLEAGDYTVTISDVSGCTDDVVVTVTVDEVVGTNDPTLGEAIRMFPNPARDLATIQYDLEDNLTLDVSITNTVGQVVWQRNLTDTRQGTLEVNLANFAAGIYMVQFRSADRQYTSRLVVDK